MLTIIEETKAFVKQRLPIESTGHDWHHAFRVCKSADFIALQEGGDKLVVTLAALLHDVGDWKFSEDGEHKTLEVEDFLTQHGLATAQVSHVCDIIQSTSFKGAQVEDTTQSIEAKIVQDADRLDAIGAIGIARAFAYGGHKGQPIYDPAVSTVLHQDFESYKNNKGTSINHFYEKLLLLKDKMHTPTAKHIANQRHQILESFLKDFLSQWDFKDSVLAEKKAS